MFWTNKKLSDLNNNGTIESTNGVSLRIITPLPMGVEKTAGTQVYMADIDCPWVPGITRGKERPRRDADPSPPSSAVVMKE